jgi:hypothetical protein
VGVKGGVGRHPLWRAERIEFLRRAVSRPRPVERMSNDLLPLLDILAESPSSLGRQRVLADVEVNGHGGSRDVLTHYASLGTHPEMNGAAGSMTGPAAATDSAPPAHRPTPLADGLADVAVTIRQIESILQANSMLAPEVHFAVERLQDVAMALRMREVDGALCDTLEASVREVGDAIVRNDAAASRALSAAALLADLGRRIDRMTGQGPAAAREPAEVGQSVAIETAGDHAVRADSAASGPMAQVIDGISADEDYAGSLLRPAFVPPVSPDIRDVSDAKDRAFEPADSTKSPAADPPADPQPPPDSGDAVADANIVTAEAPSEAIQTIAAQSAQSDAVEAAPSPSPVHPDGANAAISEPTPVKSRPSPNDPLAALYGLSEEELIALFS